MNRSFVVLFLMQAILLNPSKVYSQTSNRNIMPYTWQMDIPGRISTKTLLIDSQKLKDRIFEGLKNNEVGFISDFNVSLEREGTWDMVPGGKVCRLKISAPGAKGITLYFKKFFLSAGAYFHVYSDDKKQLFGAYTQYNNAPSKQFNIEIIKGSSCILEYFEPQYIADNDVFELSGLGYIYKDASDFGQAGSCQVNVNCSEGDSYRTQQKSVCRILIKELSGLKWCTGTLVNNTKQDCTPFVLTAFHCAGKAVLADYNEWIFYYQYESSGCNNPGTEPISKTITGATLRARSTDGGDSSSDFILCEINQKIPTMYDVTFIGWRKTNVTSIRGTSIHHPSGDIKKISTFKTPLISSSFGGVVPNTHWEVFWSSTDNGFGVTQEGSSGAPIFDANGLLMGTLSGGASSCTTQTLQDFYGKLSVQFSPPGSSNASQRLQEWLDPISSGVNTLTHQSVGNCPFVSATSEVLYTSLRYYIQDKTLFLKSDEQVQEIIIYDINGREMGKFPGFRELFPIDVSAYQKGTYILHLKYASTPIRKKFLID